MVETKNIVFSVVVEYPLRVREIEIESVSVKKRAKKGKGQQDTLLL